MAELWIESAARDVAHGFRVFRGRPALLVSATLVLGLTAGATISLVALVDRLLLKPLSISHPDRLVQVLRPAAPGGIPSEHIRGPLIEQLRPPVNRLGTLLTVGYPFSQVVSYSSNGFQPEAVQTQRVDVAAFEALEIRPRGGRSFERDDAQRGSQPVAVLSYEYWRTRFLSAPDVIGRRIRSHDQSLTIVGVLEPGFSELDAASALDIWPPACPLRSRFV